VAVNTRLTKLRVLGLEATPRARLLTMRWLYYEQRQDDGCSVDWEGYQRTSGEQFLEWRMRGYVRADQGSIPWGQKRPTCHSMIVGETVDTYTSLLLGDGRQPAIRISGDDASSKAIEALFQHAGVWPVLAEGRKHGGAQGAFGVLVEVRNGKLSTRILRPEHVYIEWADECDWIPDLVIEQKRVTIERIGSSGRVECAEVWRTRAWDQTHSYAYRDHPIGSSAPVEGETKVELSEDIELTEPPREHKAGRCPVVWVQNTLCSDEPLGVPDCEAVYEQVDQLDKSMSMVMRGSRANNDPTLVVKDTQSGLSQWTRRRKGYGAEITVSEKGSVELLETKGAAIDQSWKSINALESRIERRTGVVAITPEKASSNWSGIALKILHRTQLNRAGERRNPLGVGIRQLVRITHTLLRSLGMRDVGSTGPGIEIPQAERKVTADDGTIETISEPHDIGTGGAVVLNWPALYEPIPDELRTAADALSKMTGGRPVLSQETSVAYAVALAQTDTDPAMELERIRGEMAEKVAAFDETMMPDVADTGDGADTGATDTGVTGDGTQPAAGDQQVQHEAMNGIQVKTLGDTLARTGRDLTPEASKFTINQGFPNTTLPDSQRRLDAAIDAQIKKVEEDGGVAEAGKQVDTLGQTITRRSTAQEAPAAAAPYEDNEESDQEEPS
jgi:hypothetical protein